MKKIDPDKRIKKVISKADVILEVIDARFPELTRNKKYEAMVKKKGKKLVVCANKIDLTPKKQLIALKKKHPSFILISAQKRKNIKQIRTKLSILRKQMKKENLKVGVIGYANTGKSSLINALKGRYSARTAKLAGFTRGEQFFRISKNLLLIDSPGTIYDPKKTEFEMFLINAKNIEQLTDPINTAEKILEVFNIPLSLSQIAEEKKFKQKGGDLDLERAAIFVLRQYQNNTLSNLSKNHENI